MELADHVADHARAFLERGAGIEPQLLHGEKKPAMDRLQPVARVRQRPMHDGGERIGEIALLQRIAQRDLFDVAFVGGNQSRSHWAYLIRRPAMNKRGAPAGEAGMKRRIP